MAGAAVTALANGVDSGQYIENDIARRRFGFFSGVYSRKNDNIGTIAGAKAFASMSSRGTPTSAMDAAQATMAGASMGIMPGLQNYNTIINSTAGISNIMPGTGLEGGMGAVAALNQGSSVNKLRMLGIQVRDQNGFMRDVEDIARDLWKSLNANKSGRTNISEKDLSFSLQPGNSLDMLLDQYFGTDAVLRQAIVSYLFQFAKNNGAKIGGGYQTEAGKKELLTTGASPGIVENIGRRNKAGQANVNAYTSGGILGIQSANDTISNVTAITTSMMPILESLVTATTFSQTLGSAGNGSGGILIKGAIDTAKGAADISLEAVKAAKYIAIAAAVALGVGSIVRHSTQMTDELWADQIAAGKRTPYDNGPSAFDTANGQLPDPNMRGGYPIPGGTPTATDITNTSPIPPTGSHTGIAPKPVVPKPVVKKPTAYPKVWHEESNTRSLTAKQKWARNFITELGGVATDAHVSAIVNWMQNEDTNGWNNPLATTATIEGVKSTKMNSAGVQAFDTEQQGIDAAVKTLSFKNHGYEDIVSRLKNKDTNEASVWSAIAASDWSGSNYHVQKGFTNYNGATININIPNAANMDPKQLAAAIYEALDDQGQVAHAMDSHTGGGGH
jgi:hypothetical protein